MAVSYPFSVRHGLESPRGPGMERWTAGPMNPGASLVRTSLASLSRLKFWGLGKSF